MSNTRQGLKPNVDDYYYKTLRSAISTKLLSSLTLWADAKKCNSLSASPSIKICYSLEVKVKLLENCLFVRTNILSLYVYNVF